MRFDGRAVQFLTNNDKHFLPIGNSLYVHRVAGGIQFAPAVNGLQKALDAQNMPAGRISKQCPSGILQLGQRKVQLHEIQRRERLVLVKMQLDVAGLTVAAAVQPLHIGVGQGVPGLAQRIGVRSKAAGAVAGFQRTVQMRQCCLSLAGGGQLAAAHQHHARAGGFAGQQILALVAELRFQQRVHNGNNIAKRVPAVQWLVPQHVIELVHVENAAWFHQYAVKALHRQRDQLGAHSALVGVAIAAAADGLDVAIVAQQILQQHYVDVHRAEVIFQNADALPAGVEPVHIFAQKRCFSCA